MKRQWLLAMSVLCAVVLASLSSAAGPDQPDDKSTDRAKEVTVTVHQLPAAVKTTLIKEVGSARVEEVEKKTSRDRTTYEVTVLIDQHKWEVTIREDGQLLKKELDDDEDDDEEDKD